jgi:Flp pilus assembly protein TadG
VAPSRRARSTAHRLAPDPGSATVELAAAIPLLLAVTLAMVGLLGLARDQVLAQGAAREAAREAAIGGDLSLDPPMRVRGVDSWVGW